MQFRKVVSRNVEDGSEGERPQAGATQKFTVGWRSGGTGRGKEETAPTHGAVERTRFGDWLAVGNESEGKVKDDSRVSSLSDRAEDGTFTEISTTARGWVLRECC